MPKNHTPRYIAIADRHLLANVIRRNMYGRWKTQVRYAEKLGISQVRVSALLRENVGRITPTTFGALVQTTSMRDWPDLARAVMIPEAREAFDAHNRWLARELQPFNLHHLGFLNDPFVDAPREYESWRVRQKWPEEATWRWQEVSVLLELLLEHPDCKGHFEKFFAWTQRHGYEGDMHSFAPKGRRAVPSPSARIKLALVRVVAPLAAAYESAVERGWYELEESGELGEYVKLALKRERILLNRAPDLERAQEIGTLMADWPQP